MTEEVVYGVYGGMQTGRRSPKSGVPLWKWTLIRKVSKVPSVDEIKQILKENGAVMGYVMRLKPRPWTKVSETIKL